jgi:hypothetical protein
MWRILAGLLLTLPTAVQAIDPGTATGRFIADGREIALTHAIALRQGNEEGLIDENRTMRVVLSDVEVAPCDLQGIAFLPVGDRAKAGEVHGLLLEFDPADRNAMLVTILDKPADGGQSLATISLSDSSGLWKKLAVADTRITGEIDHPSNENAFAATFSAPVFENRITADLKGTAARNSEQVRLLIARTEAFARGDMAAVGAMTSAKGRRGLDRLTPEYAAELRKTAPAMIAEYRRVGRVVVRGNTAVALLPEQGSWQDFIIEDGKWLID